VGKMDLARINKAAALEGVVARMAEEMKNQ